MELSASYSHPLGGGFDGSLHAGLPGEPAFGPPAFMHRQAAMDSPEALEPDDNEARTSLSALYVRPLGDEGSLSATLAWARKDRIPGDALQAWLAEGAIRPNPHWTIFPRAEQVEQDELAGHHGGASTVRKLSVGAIYEIPLSATVKLGFGGLVSAFDAPASLGYDEPTSTIALLRLKIG